MCAVRSLPDSFFFALRIVFLVECIYVIPECRLVSFFPGAPQALISSLVHPPYVRDIKWFYCHLGHRRRVSQGNACALGQE